MTVTGHLGVSPNLTALFDQSAFIPYWWVGPGIIKIQVGADKKGICTEDIMHVSAKSKKQFFNQSSLVFRMQLPDAATLSQTQMPVVSVTSSQSAPGAAAHSQVSVAPSVSVDASAPAVQSHTPVTLTFKETNIKLFKNGGFQMTGISSEAMARESLRQLFEMNKGRGIWPTEPTIQKFNVCMMNSDYSIGKAIRRDRLYKILVETHGLWSSFEPTIYQGVNTKFFWNKERPADSPPGICFCPEPCDGSASGYGVGKCKKITISPFRTGSIIITGAQHPEQLYDAYDFMNGVLRDNPDVLRDEVVPTRRRTNMPTTVEGILAQKMRGSPRNIVRL
jgi:TATA-box binding protein (TBP) (component of TFIID and TFIIIB)